MMAEKRYIKTWANLEDARRTVGGPDLSLGVGTVDLFAEIEAGIASGELDLTGTLGNTLVTTTDTQTISGAKTFSSAVTTSAGIAGGASADITLNTNKFTVDATQGNVVTDGDLSFTETVTSPATSASYAIKSKQLVHTCTAAATNTVAVQIPVRARIIGASAIVSTALAFAGGGASAALTWATSAETVADPLAAKNSKGSALFDQNSAVAIVSGSAEDMTLTPNAGTIAVGGVLVVTVWYEELSGLTNVA